MNAEDLPNPLSNDGDGCYQQNTFSTGKVSFRHRYQLFFSSVSHSL